jgi:hypothetical protein
MTLKEKLISLPRPFNMKTEIWGLMMKNFITQHRKVPTQLVETRELSYDQLLIIHSFILLMFRLKIESMENKSTFLPKGGIADHMVTELLTSIIELKGKDRIPR